MVKVWRAKVTAGWSSGRFGSWPVAGFEVLDHFPWLPYPPFLNALSTREATTGPVLTPVPGPSIEKEDGSAPNAYSPTHPH
jgi:hypothetical protein